MPIVISKQWVGITDPHQKLTVRGAGAGKLVKLSEFMAHQGHAKCFRNVFDVTQSGSYNATLFRFPLRQKGSESKISSNCYSPAKVCDNLFASLQEEAPILLLFLKNVLKISMYEWYESSDGPQCIYCMDMSNNVTQYRTKCLSLAQEYNGGTSNVTNIVLTSVTSKTWAVKKEPEQYHWLVLNAIGSDLEELRKCAKSQRVLPWVGIAAPLPINLNLNDITIGLDNISDINGIERVMSTLKQCFPKPTLCDPSMSVSNTAAGQAFCFLPLPGSISLPVNLHGYFAVADNRRSIKWPSHDEKGEEAKWNEMLLQNLVCPLYALLLSCRSSLIQYNKKCHDNDAYAAWPVHAEVKNQQIWSHVLEPVMSRIVNLPLLWAKVSDGGVWVTPKNAYFVDPNVVLPEIVLRIITQLGYKIVDLPCNIHDTILTNKEMKETITRRYVTAEFVRHAMRNKEAILQSIPKKQIYEFLEYILSDQPSSDSLIDIEILPLIGATEFTTLNDKQVFLIPDKHKDCLEFLPGIESSVVDIELPFRLQEQLERLANEKKLQLILVTPDIICNQLIRLSVISWCPSLTDRQYIMWKPNQFNNPSREWIACIWSWIQRFQAASKISAIPLVPTEVVSPSMNEVNLYPLNFSLGLCTIIVDNLPEKCSPDTMLIIVKKIDLVPIQKLDFILKCPGVSEYIKICDVHYLLKHIGRIPSKSLSPTEKDCLRTFFSSSSRVGLLTSKEKDTLRDLTIFIAGVGGSTCRYLSLNHQKCILPPQGIEFSRDIEYPPEILSYENVQVATLLERLDIARSPQIDTFCEKVILPYVMQQAQWGVNEDKLVMWVLQLPLINSRFLREFSIIKSNHQRMKPTELYDPTEQVFCNLFDCQSDNAFPDDEYNNVLPTLRRAGLRTWHNLCEDPDKMLDFLVNRARSISKITKLEGLNRSIRLVPLLIEQQLINDSRISNISFLFPQKHPPEYYPTNLKWYGVSNPQVMCPRDMCIKTSEFFLAGSVLPFLSDEYSINEWHKGFCDISSVDIINHFKEVVLYAEESESEKDKINDMVIKIYHALYQADIGDFPDNWIWWRSRNKFLKPDKCIFTMPAEITTLEPHLYCLSSNPELQVCVSSLLPRLPHVQIQQSLSKDHAIVVLEELNQPKGRILKPEEVQMSVRLLNWLKSQSVQSHGDIFVPTTSLTLALVSESTYDDRNWNTAVKKSKYTFVHEDIPPALAKYLHVTPLSRRVAPSKNLKVKYTKTGQHEPITRRIRRIVEEYATGSDIFKELLQNADDAGATEVKFLIDWRQHQTGSLLADELACWQGPALIAYNNAVFSEQDFEHICELAGETKMKDPLKTGRFGVGFCATYQMTDVPSFISRKYFTMFDPHTSYLGDRVSLNEPGMRIDLVENKEDLSLYSDQFQPYNGLFQCNVFDLPDSGFDGTLFRFPFRSSETADKSQICREVYNQQTIKDLLQEFTKQSPYLILFLKHVSKVSVYVLNKGDKIVNGMKKTMEVERTCKCSPQCSRINLIRSDTHSVETNVCHSTIKRSQCEEAHWLVCSAVTPSVKDKLKKDRGLVSFAEVGFKFQLDDTSEISPEFVDGYAFCFLPLPMKTHLPFHINGFFEISKDRSGLKYTDDKRFGKDWNDSLCSTALMHAYVKGLSVLVEKSPLCSEEVKKKYLQLYYGMFKLTEKNELSGFSTSIKEVLPQSEADLVWSEVDGGRWLQPRKVVILTFMDSEKHMHRPAADVLLELGYEFCDIPQHMVILFKEYSQLYDCQTFYTKILLPNLRRINSDLRDRHIIFLLKHLHHYTWIEPLLSKKSFVPVKECNDLVTPEHLIDENDLLTASLFDVEEGRFPEDCFNNDHIMACLRQLGMPSKLSLKDIEDRAKTVQTLHLTNRSKSIERSWLLLKYIQKKHVFYQLTILSTVPFLPTSEKPNFCHIPWNDANELVAPDHVFIPKWNSIIFSVCPVVIQPEGYDLKSDILALVGASKEPPSLDFVINHLINLSKASKEFNEGAVSYLAEPICEIYNFMQTKLQYRSQKEVAPVKEKLQSVNFIWQDNRFLVADQVVLKWTHNCYPYICQLSSNNSKFKYLFRLLGVKETPSVDDLANILCRIAGVDFKAEDNVVPEHPVSQQLIDIIEEIVKKLSELLKGKHENLELNLYLPDEKCVMRPVKQLACDKVATDKEDWVQSLQMFTSQFEAETFHFLHPSIPRERAITLGVKPLLDALIQGVEDNEFMKGIDYGQHEDLCDRLKSILGKYPADHSILNEFVQNADDAHATEVVFVLDHRSFSQEKLFPSEHQSWKDLQKKPALCILNNRRLTDDDIKGIAKLGRGGKQNSSDTIGRFGIGFNVAYHVTDCPSFVSFSDKKEPESFCVFDPTCSFANTTKQNPGKRWQVSSKIASDFTGQFEPYMFRDISTPLLDDMDNGHVVFRLPLTRKKNYYSHLEPGFKKKTLLSPKIFHSNDISKLFKTMEQYAQDLLLFLNHVKKISAVEIKEDDEFITHFRTQLTMSHEARAECRKFYYHTKQMNENALTVIYSVHIRHNVPALLQPEGDDKNWLVCKKYSPMKGEREDDADEVELNMRPLGGVAAAMGDSDVNGRLFCFLPMPLHSNLPVHINGHFLVDDSRKHLEKKQKRYSSWNLSLATNIIAPCYVDILLHAQKMTERGETDPKWLYKLFPNLNSEGEVATLKLPETIYTIILDRNPAIFLQRHPDTNFATWFTLSGSTKGFFHQRFVSEDTQKEVTANPKLRSALVRLGMHIFTEDVPEEIHEHIKKIKNDFSATLKPEFIIQHLRDRKVSHNSEMKAILTFEVLQLLLSFLIKSMTVPDLKKALSTVPLLLTLDNHLWSGETLYKSKYHLLLPSCSNHFIHIELEETEIGKLLTENKMIVDLPVTFVRDNIVLSDIYQPIKMDDVPTTTIELIKRLWEFINGVSLISLYKSVADIIKEYFSLKPLLLADDRYLYPMTLNDSIISSIGRKTRIRSAFHKLGYPTISNQWGVELLGNRFSDGNDIINCLKLKAPPLETADLHFNEVRCIIEAVRDHRELRSIASQLRRLKIFKTVNETFMSMNGNPCVYVMPQDIPKGGIEQIQEKCKTKYVILDGADNFTMEFYRIVIDNINAGNKAEFYRHVILPHIHELEIKYIQDHLKHIQCNSDLKRQLLENLKNVKLIKFDDEAYQINEICDPENIFFQNFCADRLLPEPWKQEMEEWFPLFKDLGFRYKVVLSEWIHHAKLFEEQQHDCDWESCKSKSKALLETLLTILDNNLYSDRLLNEISTIQFIYNDDPEPQLITVVNKLFVNQQIKWPNETFFCFKGSVMNSKCSLAVLYRKVLPSCCEESLKPFVCKLGIESPIHANTIQQNLLQLSGMYTCVQSFSCNVKNTEAMRKILVSHLIELDRSNITDVDINVLRETLCIAVTQATSPLQILTLVKPSQLIRTVQSNIEMEPFYYQVPSNISLCTKLLNAFDIPHELSARHCIEILSNIHYQLQLIKQKLPSNDKFKRIALNAYVQLVCSLRKKSEDFQVVLFLPSEDDELLQNTDLLYNDAKWYAQRLPKNNDFQFLKLPPPDSNGDKVPPHSLKVKRLTSVVVEELHEDMFSSDCCCTCEQRYATDNSKVRCRVVQNILDTMKSVELRTGLCRVYFSERQERPSKHFEEILETLTEIKIVCVTTKRIVTVLKRDDAIIPNSQCRDKYCHASNKPASIMIAPHDKDFDETEFLQNMSSALSFHLHNEIKNEALLIAMIKCEPSEIEAQLDKLTVSPYDPMTIKETKYQQIGEVVPFHSLLLCDCLIILNFNIGEMVHFYDTCSGNITTAKVTKVNICDNFLNTTVTLCVKMEDDEENRLEEREISPGLIFKLLTPPQQIVLFSDSTNLSLIRANTEPIHLAPIPDGEIDQILESKFFSELPQPMKIMRLICHIYHTNNKGGSALRENFAHYCKRVEKFLQSVDPTSLGIHVLNVAVDLNIPAPVMGDISSDHLSFKGCYGLSPVMSSSVHHVNQPSTQNNTVPQQHYHPYQSRFQPQQRSRGQPSQQRQHTYRFQPQALAAPPTSERNAQIWLDQAKMDYRAALFLMEGVTVTPTIVPCPEECELVAAENTPYEQDSSESKEDEYEEIVVTVNSDEVESQKSDISSLNEIMHDTKQGRPQFPAVVCFLCHEAVEKSIKGVMYAYCGVKSDLVNCNNLVSLLKSLQCSNHRPPKCLEEQIKHCVMQVNEHQTKSRLPNFQIPPCAPALAYTSENAEEALLETRKFLEALMNDERIKPLLNLEELPIPQFPSMHRSMSGNHSKLHHQCEVIHRTMNGRSLNHSFHYLEY